MNGKETTFRSSTEEEAIRNVQLKSMSEKLHSLESCRSCWSIAEQVDVSNEVGAGGSLIPLDRDLSISVF